MYRQHSWLMSDVCVCLAVSSKTHLRKAATLEKWTYPYLQFHLEAVLSTCWPLSSPLKQLGLMCLASGHQNVNNEGGVSATHSEPHLESCQPRID